MRETFFFVFKQDFLLLSQLVPRVCPVHLSRTAFVARLDALDWNLIIRRPKHPLCGAAPCATCSTNTNRNRLSKYYSGGGLKFPPLIQRVGRHAPARGLGVGDSLPRYIGLEFWMLQWKWREAMQQVDECPGHISTKLS